jgi:uncharacterized delta-60 repeat protein
MKRKVWIAICAILAAVPLLIPLEGGRGPARLEKWVARYDGHYDTDIATAIAVDSSGNIYVTGKSWGWGTNYDYATIKYDPSGSQLWAARYNGPGNFWDEASAIAVDRSGSVYVTGRSVGHVSNNEVITTDYATIKYNANGKQLWAKRYAGAHNAADEARAIAVDRSGNVYITGSSEGYTSASDYLTIKYSPSGKQLWVAKYNGPGNFYDEARAISVDRSGNIYVTGDSVGSGTGDDIATIKYNSNGKQLWLTRFNGSGSHDDEVSDLAVDGSGNIYVTGSSPGPNFREDFLTIKCDTNGKQLWAKRYNGPANGFDTAKALALDSLGNVYITGRCQGKGDQNWDYATIKYNTNGKQLWVKRYNGPANSEDVALDIAVDSSGNVYVTGWSEGVDTDPEMGNPSDYATIKYNPSGKQLWVERYNGPSKHWDGAYAIAVDGSGNVYVTGGSDTGSVGGPGPSDYATLKY